MQKFRYKGNTCVVLNLLYVLCSDRKMDAIEENPATTESFGLLETDSRPAHPTIVSNLNNQLQSSTNSLGGRSKRWRSICCWLSSTFGCAICVLLAAILIRAWTVQEIFVRNVIDPNPSMITVTRFGRQLIT